MQALVALLVAGCGGGGPLPLPDGGETDGQRRVDLRPRPPIEPDGGSDATASDARGSASGLDPGRAVVSLSDGELGRLCDWGVGVLGGYGTTVFCTDGTQIRNSPSRQSCIAGHDRSARCLASVGDTEDCLSTLALLGCSQALISGRPSCQLMASCQRP